MKKIPYLLVLLSLILAGCKSNPEAYSSTYRKLREKEESAAMDAKTRPAMNVPTTYIFGETGIASERFNLILGKEENVSTYNIVARSFINRTNARGYYSQMVENGYPAALIQNDDNMYRILIGAFAQKEDAESKLKEIKQTYQEASLLIRIK